MEVQVTITQILQPSSFTSKKDGQVYNKYSFVGKTTGKFSKMLKFDIFGDEKFNKLNFEVGKYYNIFFDAESREFSGKWYTTLNCWNATLLDVNFNQNTQYVGMPAQ